MPLLAADTVVLTACNVECVLLLLLLLVACGQVLW